MTNVTLVDFSQTVVAAVAVEAKDVKEGDTKNLIKHIALNILLNIKSKFGKNIILCCDSKNYWRKKEFQYYKGHRKLIKEKSDYMDWTMVGEVMTEIKKELLESFPYMLLEVDGAEADDIIAVLCKYYQTNEMNSEGLFEVPKEILIYSSDNDFVSLQKYKNVKQWHNPCKKFVTCDNPREYLIEKICVGDGGDNIPSIPNPDAWSQCRTEGIPVRAKSFMKTRLPDFYRRGIDACENKAERKAYERNIMLIDFDSIPKYIEDSILDAYKNHKILGNKNTVYKYLVSHRMKLLIQYASNF